MWNLEDSFLLPLQVEHATQELVWFGIICNHFLSCKSRFVPQLTWTSMLPLNLQYLWNYLALLATCWIWLSIDHHCLSFQLLVLVDCLGIQAVHFLYQKTFHQINHLIGQFLWNLYLHFGCWKLRLMLCCGDHKLYHHKALWEFQDLPESEPLATRN